MLQVTCSFRWAADDKGGVMIAVTDGIRVHRYPQQLNNLITSNLLRGRQRVLDTFAELV